MSGETQEVDAYLRGLDPERRTALSDLRAIVFEVVPDAVETMRYWMPTYEYGGDMLCAFASHKRHMSLYLDPRIVEEAQGAVEGLEHWEELHPVQENNGSALGHGAVDDE